MKLYYLLITLFLCLFSIQGSSQSFEITNSRKSKIIESTDNIDIRVGTYYNKDEHCCDYGTYSGKIDHITKDSLYMRVNQVRLTRVMKDSKDMVNHLWKRDQKLIPIALDQITDLRISRMSNSFEKQRNTGMIGFGLFVGGFISALNSAIIVDSAQRRKVLLLSGIEFGVGFVFIQFSRKKRYKFKNDDDPWSFEIDKKNKM